MSRQLPHLAMDGVLCDRPQEGCFISGKRNYSRDTISSTTKKETSKVKTMSASDASAYGALFVKNRAVADRFLAKCMGQDSSMDGETVEKLKAFLQSKLSSEDHAAACSMIDGGEAQDDMPEPAVGERLAKEMHGAKVLAGDAKATASFHALYPDAARIRIDNSGIQPRARAASYSADGAASFAAMFPDAARIKLA